MKKLLQATHDTIIVTPELFNELNNIRLKTTGDYIVKVNNDDIQVLGMIVKVVEYENWIENGSVEKLDEEYILAKQIKQKERLIRQTMSELEIDETDLKNIKKQWEMWT